MITTNYLISKQLAEKGFSEQVGFLDYYFNTDKELRHRDQENYLDGQNTEVDCFSYDLETILEALPKEIELEDGDYYFTMGGYYGGWRIAYQVSVKAKYIFTTSKNESLADTAAKMWLKLKKDNLI